MSLPKFLGKASLKSEPEEETSPKLEKVKQRQVKELLGREFRVVKNGLDPAEVMACLEEVVGSSDAVLKRLERFVSLRKLTETMEATAEATRQMSEHVKEQARKEARAEKAQVIEEARRRTQEMIEQTRMKCIAYIESTNSVLLEANTKAREMEAMAFKKAREMGAMVTEEIQQNIHNTVGIIARDVNSGAETPADEPPTSQAQAVKTPPDTEVQETVLTKERDPELVELEEALGSVLGSQTTDIGIEEERKPINIEAAAAAPKEYNFGLYSGRVTLLILGGAGKSWMQQLRDQLYNIPSIHIRLEAGSDTGGSILTLSLDEPFALASLLLEMPDVEKVVEDARDLEEPSGSMAKTFRQRLPEDPQRTTLLVVLNGNGNGNGSSPSH